MAYLQDIPRRETSITRDPEDLDDSSDHVPACSAVNVRLLYIGDRGSIVTVQFLYVAHDPSQHPNLPLQSIEDLRIP